MRISRTATLAWCAVALIATPGAAQTRHAVANGANPDIFDPVSFEESAVGGGGEYGTPCCNQGCCKPKCCCAPPIHRTGFFADVLYLHATDVDMVFGIPQNGIGTMGTAPNGGAGIADPDYEVGYRVGGNYALDCNTSLRATWTWFESDVQDSLIVTGPPVSNVIRPTTIFPGTINAGSIAQQAFADYQIDFNTADLDYRVVWKSCNHYTVDLVFGARYANLEQDFGVLYEFSPRDGNVTVDSNIDFDGAGFRFGLEGERRLYCGSCLTFYGRGMANFLAGEYRASYTQTNQLGGQVAHLQWSDDRITPILEGEMGLSYCAYNGMLRVSAGYYMTAWMNAVTTPEWVRATQELDLADVSDTLTFDGLVGRVELSY